MGARAERPAVADSEPAIPLRVWTCTHLRESSGHVHDAPVSDTQVTAELQDVDGIDIDRVPACRHPHELTGVSGDERDPCDDFVAFLEQVVNICAEVASDRVRSQPSGTAIERSRRRPSRDCAYSTCSLVIDLPAGARIRNARDRRAQRATQPDEHGAASWQGR